MTTPKFNFTNLTPEESVRLNNITDTFVLSLLDMIQEQQETISEQEQCVRELEEIEEELRSKLDSIKEMLWEH
jgi:hypothetical protein